MAVEPRFENVAERILEILQTDVAVHDAVVEELQQRFPKNAYNMSAAQREEVICMQQIIVYKRILEGIV